MGNPAEKTIRNPNLKRLLFKVWKPVNKNFILQQNFFLAMVKSVNFYNIVRI